MTEDAQSLPIVPRGPIDANVRVPGSKSITNRALPLAFLATGDSELTGCLRSDDTEVMCEALRALGGQVDLDGTTFRVRGHGPGFPPAGAPLYVKNSGTSARFLTAMLTLGAGPVVLDGNQRMRERPISHLRDALEGLGARIEILGRDECPPVKVSGGGLPGGSVYMDASASSQYVSAVTMVAPFARQDVQIHFLGRIVSRPYIDLTLQVMNDFGVEAKWGAGAGETGENTLLIKAGQQYRARDYAVEPDASSAVYPLCAAAITGGRVRIEGIPDHSIQADLAIVDLLEAMGCRISRKDDAIELIGPKKGLRSLGEVNMNDCPDASLAYAVVALFADGPTVINDIWNLKIKETDRLAALENELCRMGARAEAGEDWLRIQPGPLHDAKIETYDDHRMAMSFALAGLRVPGIEILDPACVSKTWPDFFDMLESL
ncbi:MAG: 3-phosphoshikimate 1-carboxyvinyltransferase [bacterium]|nr:3-phosphoshikimate 1-carboxyvinyltransferase [bacterium]MCP5044494.1 3-phosphoshikimate 1-carboxyvinyltransferase [bacterium]